MLGPDRYCVEIKIVVPIISLLISVLGAHKNRPNKTFFGVHTTHNMPPPPKNFREAYSNRTVRPSVRPASCPVNISYTLSGRNPKFSVWLHLRMAECCVPFSSCCDLNR